MISHNCLLRQIYIPLMVSADTFQHLNNFVSLLVARGTKQRKANAYSGRGLVRFALTTMHILSTLVSCLEAIYYSLIRHIAL